MKDKFQNQSAPPGLPVLDHIFVCVAPDPPEARRLRELGFTVDFQREHRGQGTRNDLLLFPHSYLELLSLADLREAQASIVRLDRRCDWQASGASPFGIALRGRREECGALQWTPYEVPGAGLKLWIVTATLKDPRLPLVFLFEARRDDDAQPSRGHYPHELLVHDNGATGLEHFEFAGPGYGAGFGCALPRSVTLVDGPTPQLRVRVAGAKVRGPVGLTLRLV